MLHATRRGWTQSVRRSFFLFLTALIIAGCGDSDNGAVITGNNNTPPAATTGNVTFNFVKAQSALVVPQATTNLRFRFYTGTDTSGTPAREELHQFAAAITITNLDLSLKTVVITAFAADGTPLVQAAASITVVAGQTTNFDFTGITATPVTVTQVTVTPASQTVSVGGTRQFNSTVTYSSGDVLTGAGRVTWTAENGATVTSTGLATGTAEGTATVTASAGGTQGNASLTVVGDGQDVTTLTITPTSQTIEVGETFDFDVSGEDADGNPVNVDDATFSITGTAAVINSDSGLVTGVNPGAGVVTVRLGSATATAILTVVAQDTSITLQIDPETASVEVGSTFDFDVSGEDAQGNPIDVSDALFTISGSNASIDANTGVATGLTPGQATVTVHLNGTTDTATLTVTARPLDTVTISPDNANVATGNQITFTSTAQDTGGSPISTADATYSVTNGTGSAIIDPLSGVLTAQSEGSVTVAVSLTVDGVTRTDSTTLTIMDVPGNLLGIETTPAAATLDIGQTALLATTADYEEATDVTVTNADGLTYSSSNSAVASVDPTTGVVVALRQGTTVITASLGAQTDTVTVTVNFPNGINQSPLLNLQGTNGVNRGPAGVPFGSTTLEDDQGAMTPGLVTITSNNPNVFINPPTTTIGSVGGSGSARTITLGANATPAAVQALLRSITVDTTAAALGEIFTLTVTVDDGGTPASADAVQSRILLVRGENAVDLFVGPGGSLATIQAAVNQLTAGGDNNQDYSTITVAPGDRRGEGTITIPSDPDTNGLRLYGGEQGSAAGVSPTSAPAPRDTVTRITRIDLSASNAVIDGFEIEGAGPNATYDELPPGPGNVGNPPGIVLGSTADNATITNSVFDAPTFGLGFGITNLGSGGDPPMNLHVLNNYFTNQESGLWLQANSPAAKVTGVLIQGNIFINNERGVNIILPADDVRILDNGFHDNYDPVDYPGQVPDHIGIDGFDTAITLINGNDFSGLGKVRLTGPFANNSITADGNWWGLPSGPNLAEQTEFQVYVNSFLTQDPFPYFP